jgi:hypothetical protein
VTLGRPTKYQAKYCDDVIEHMATGLSFASFAGVIGVHKDTLNHWVNTIEEFAEAKGIGMSKNLLYWEEEGRRGLWEEKDGPKFNSRVWSINMKNRHDWGKSDAPPPNTPAANTTQLVITLPSNGREAPEC